MTHKALDIDFNLPFIWKCSLLSLFKFNPKNYIYKPVLLVIYILAILSLGQIILDPDASSTTLNIVVALSIWLLLYFSNFAETLAELKGKALREQFQELLTPKNLTVLRDNKLVKISEAQLQKTDLIKASAGDTISIDGEVIQGIASVDESPITGESATIYKENTDGRNQVLAGSKVVADSLLYRPYLSDNELPVLDIKVTKTSKNERAIVIFLTGLTFVNIVMALSFFNILHLLNIEVHWEFIIAFIICIIPTTAAALMGTVTISGSKKLMKTRLLPFSANIVDIASDINLIVFDKTGTITTGNRELERYFLYKGASKAEFIRALHLASFQDATPEGRSITTYLNYHHSEMIDKIDTANVEFVPFNSADKFSGCKVGDDFIRKGAVPSIETILQKKKVKIEQHFNNRLLEYSQKGFTPIVLIKNDKILGACVLKDEMKVGMKSRIARLKSMGIKTVLLTGDNYHIAKSYADEGEFDEFHSDATPDDKMKVIINYKEQGYVVAMCGEGVNDNLALKESDLGFGTIDSDISTRNSSDVVDLDNDPLKIITLIEISRNLLSTKGCITTFSLLSDIAKFFAILPAILIPFYPSLAQIDILNLSNAESAVASSIIFNSLIVVLFLPLAFTGVKHLNYKTLKVVKIFFLIFGLGGLIIPFFGIKLINMLIANMFL